MQNSGRGLLISLLVLVLVVGAFLAGGFTGWILRDPALVLPFSAPPPTSVTHVAQEEVPEQLREQFEIFWQAWSLLEEKFYDPSQINYTRMVYGAVKGMYESVDDPYTLFSTPAETGVSRTHLEGEYEGIGAYIDQENGFPVILGPVSDDTPAARAGLRLGDIVLEVDGRDVEGMPLEEVIALIKGPAGTEVKLLIARTGEVQPFEVAIIRAHIDIASVEGEMREDGLAYVSVSVFGDTTSAELDQVLEELLKSKPSGLILDLRGNGGGYLVAAQELVGHFVREGVATYKADRDGERTPLPILNGRVNEFDLPMVVLVDGGSASASEITAGALQDYKRAILIGEQTFGKGSIQDITDLPDGSSARITIAHWLTPDGREIHGKGLTPDILVPRTPEDYDAGLDPPLAAAVAYLLGQPLPASAATPTPRPW